MKKTTRNTRNGSLSCLLQEALWVERGLKRQYEMRPALCVWPNSPADRILTTLAVGNWQYTGSQSRQALSCRKHGHSECREARSPLSLLRDLIALQREAD